MGLPATMGSFDQYFFSPRGSGDGGWDELHRNLMMAGFGMDTLDIMQSSTIDVIDIIDIM